MCCQSKSVLSTSVINSFFITFLIYILWIYNPSTFLIAENRESANCRSWCRNDSAAEVSLPQACGRWCQIYEVEYVALAHCVQTLTPNISWIHDSMHTLQRSGTVASYRHMSLQLKGSPGRLLTPTGDRTKSDQAFSSVPAPHRSTDTRGRRKEGYNHRHEGRRMDRGKRAPI